MSGVGGGGGLAMGVVPEGRDVRLVLRGALEAAAVRDAARRFEDALFLHPGRAVVVDMHGVTSVDGDAVTMVLGWISHAADERRTVRIVGAPEEVERRMRLVGIISAYGGYQAVRSSTQAR